MDHKRHTDSTEWFIPAAAGALAVAGAAAGVLALWNAHHSALAAKDAIISAERRAKAAAETALRSISARRSTEGPIAGDVRVAMPVAKDSQVRNAARDAPAEGWTLECRAIARAESCFRISRGTPRQGAFAPDTRARLRLEKWVSSQTFTGLESFSHAIVIFAFDTNTNEQARRESAASGRPRAIAARVRPPALGGKKVGLFASRTPHRPNPIGCTVVRLLRVSDGIRSTDAAGLGARHARPDGRPGRGGEPKGGWVLVSGVDFTDGTPVLDVKPLVAACDCPAGSVSPDWVASLPGRSSAARPVFWAPAALAAAGELCRSKGVCRLFSAGDATSLVRAASQVLASDVRPARQRGGAAAVRGEDVSLDIDGVSAWYRRVEVPPSEAWADVSASLGGAARVPTSEPSEGGDGQGGAVTSTEAVFVWAVSREGAAPPEVAATGSAFAAAPAPALPGTRPGSAAALRGAAPEPAAAESSRELPGPGTSVEAAADADADDGSEAPGPTRAPEAQGPAATPALGDEVSDEAREAWIEAQAAPAGASASGVASSWELLTNSMAP